MNLVKVMLPSGSAGVFDCPKEHRGSLADVYGHGVHLSTKWDDLWYTHDTYPSTWATPQDQGRYDSLPVTTF